MDARAGCSDGVTRWHSRPKDGVASLAYDPRVHEMPQRGLLLCTRRPLQTYILIALLPG